MTGDAVVRRGLTWVRQAACRAPPPGALTSPRSRGPVSLHHAAGSARVSTGPWFARHAAAERCRVSQTLGPDSSSVCFCQSVHSSTPTAVSGSIGGGMLEEEPQGFSWCGRQITSLLFTHRCFFSHLAKVLHLETSTSQTVTWRLCRPQISPATTDLNYCRPLN